MRYILMVPFLLLAAPVRAEEPAYQGHAAAHWAQALADEDVAVRRQAAWALGWIGHAKEVEGLVSDLATAARKDEETPVRSAAIDGLRFVGESARPAVPALLRCMGDPDAGIRAVTALALASAAEPTEAVLLALSDALEDEDDKVRSYAALALAGFGEQAAPAADALIAAFRAHDDRGSRRTLAGAIGAVGPAAKAALPDLRAMLAGEEDPPVEVAYAICRLAPDHCGAALDRLVAEGCSDAPGRALSYLRQLGPAAAAALPALKAALEAAAESRQENLRATIEAIRAK